MNAKKLFVSLVWIFCFYWVCSGQTIMYDYDACGNRIIRSEIELKSTASKDSVGLIEQKEFKDKLGDQEITIYPNPVKDELTIKIPGLKDNQSATINLVDQNGHIIQAHQKARQYSIIDFSGLSYGVYYLSVSMEDRSVKWTVVKDK